MPNNTPAPSVRACLKELVLTFRRLTCDHDYRMDFTPTHLIVKCIKCDHETGGFRIGRDRLN